MKNLILWCSLILILSSCSSSEHAPADLSNEIEQLQQQLDETKAQLKIAESVILQCDSKVKELDQYILEVSNIYEKRLHLSESHIKELDEYIDKLESFAKKNDPDGFFNRNKMMIGFIGGTLFCGTAVWGAGQLN